MRMPRWSVGVATTLVLGGSLGCTPSTPVDPSAVQSVPVPSEAASQVASATPSGSPVQPRTTPDPQDAAVQALSVSLANLSAAMSSLDQETVLRTIRADVAPAAKQARTALEGVRASAFPAASRNCSAIEDGVFVAGQAADRARSASAGTTAAAAALAAKQAAVGKSRQVVQADLTRLTQALAGSTVPAGVSPADVEAAIKAADAAVSASVTKGKELVAAITKSVQSAEGAAAEARQIAAKVC